MVSQRYLHFQEVVLSFKGLLCLVCRLDLSNREAMKVHSRQQDLVDLQNLPDLAGYLAYLSLEDLKFYSPKASNLSLLLV